MCTIFLVACEKQCSHQWDEGVKIENEADSYIIEYTCLRCGNKHTENINLGFTPKPVDELITILHAGGGADGMTHLNAQETFDYYYNLGYRYFEYDLKLSVDGRIIATHAGEHLEVNNPQDFTYEEFKALKLENGYTPANEEWLVQIIQSHPDINIVVDAKMNTTEGDAAVLERLETLESLYNLDMSTNIIPEVFSKEMWDIVKQTTTFDRYLFSHYKVYYTVDTLMEYFSDSRIWGIALPTYTDGDIRANLHLLKQTKKIFVFTPQSPAEVLDASQMGADGVYLDFGKFPNS
jgi:glycerophosphoryl diester phosphodiesterase